MSEPFFKSRRNLLGGYVFFGEGVQPYTMVFRALPDKAFRGLCRAGIEPGLATQKGSAFIPICTLSVTWKKILGKLHHEW